MNWLDAFDDVAGGEARTIIETLLDDGAADPRAAVASLFQATGVNHRLVEGRVVLEKPAAP